MSFQWSYRMDHKLHWERVYNLKVEQEVSWYQTTPTESIQLIQQSLPQPTGPIIDIGGGNSHLTEHLLALGYGPLHLLDISDAALARVQKRLGEQANQVNFISSNILEFHPKTPFRLWHDRAVFHFLTTQSEIEQYVQLVSQSIIPSGYLLLATFASTGPTVCSDLPVSRYSISDIESIFGEYFTLKDSMLVTHHKPYGGAQDFAYALLQRHS